MAVTGSHIGIGPSLIEVEAQRYAYAPGLSNKSDEQSAAEGKELEVSHSIGMSGKSTCMARWCSGLFSGSRREMVSVTLYRRWYSEPRNVSPRLRTAP